MSRENYNSLNKDRCGLRLRFCSLDVWGSRNVAVASVGVRTAETEAKRWKKADFGAIFNTKIAIFARNIALLKNFLETVLFSGRLGI